MQQHGIEQRLPAVLDGYHWSDETALSGGAGRRAMGSFTEFGGDVVERLESPLGMDGVPSVHEHGSQLQCDVPFGGGGHLSVLFTEKVITCQLIGAPPNRRLSLTFVWVPERSAFQDVSDNRLSYRFQDFDYSVTVADGTARKTEHGVRLDATGVKLSLHMAQKS